MANLALSVLRLDDGRDLGFTEFGDPEGVPVFVFHGTPGSHRHVTHMAGDATEVGVRVIAPDRPGYGHSSFDPNRKLLDWPNDVAAIADHLGVHRFGVIGISGGGPHAVVCAHALSSRVIACVSAAGVGSLAQQSDAEGMMPANQLFVRLARQAPALLRVPFSGMLVAARRLPRDKMFEQMKAQAPPADVAVFERPGVADEIIDDMAAKHATAAKAAAQDFALFAKPWGFDVSEISVPFHAWHGDEDINVPFAHSQRYVDAIAGATLHTASGLGHMVTYDVGAEILRAAAGKPV